MEEPEFPDIRQWINDLVTGLSQDLFEKDKAIRLALLSSVAGESIFLLGPPGVAKSMIARRLKHAYAGARSFEYLMGKFSTPDEVFGPVSISKLKNEDKYERLTDKYLPGANIVFLDEIWKASPPIQNSLLTVLNEKIYRNGEQEIHVNIRGLIAASNELPMHNEGLEALWDRFLIRLVIKNIQDEQAFNEMITLPINLDYNDLVPESLKITDETYHNWQQHIDQIVVPPHVLGLINHLRRSIRERNSSLPVDEAIYISDRRWRKMVQLLRTSAFLNGRKDVNIMDCFLFIDCIWNTSEQREEAEALVIGSIVAYGYRRFVDMQPIRKELDKLRKEVEQETLAVKLEQVPERKIYTDQSGVKYYKLPKFWGTDPAYIKVDDFQRLDPKEELFIPLFEMHARAFRPFQNYGLKAGGTLSVWLKNKEIQVETEMTEREVTNTRTPEEAALKIWSRQTDKMLSMVQLMMETIEAQKTQETPEIRHHLFVSQRYATHVQESIANTVNEILNLKLEIEKVQHSYETIPPN